MSALMVSGDLRRLLLSARAQTRDDTMRRSDASKPPLPGRAVAADPTPVASRAAPAATTSLPDIGSSRTASYASQLGSSRSKTKYSSSSSTTAVKKKNSAASEQPSNECPICLQPLLDAVKTACGHAFCCLCLFHPQVAACPICRAAVSVEAGDFALDTWLDLCAKIMHSSELQRRRQAMARFHSTFGSAADMLAKCQAAIHAATHHPSGGPPPPRDAAGRLLAEVQFRDAAARSVEAKSTDAAVTAQQMTFANGYMRRRAPSIVVVVSGDASPPDDDHRRRSLLAPDRNRSEVSPRARNGLSGVVVRRHTSPRSQTAVPYTVDIEMDAEGESDAVGTRRLALQAPPPPPLAWHSGGVSRGSAASLQQPRASAMDADDGDGDDPFATPRLRQQGVLAPRPTNQQQGASLPRLASADTRLLQEMRLLIKRQSLVASTRGRAS